MSSVCFCPFGMSENWFKKKQNKKLRNRATSLQMKRIELISVCFDFNLILFIRFKTKSKIGFECRELVLPYLFYGRRWHTITRFIRSAWRWWSTSTSYTPMQWPFLICHIQVLLFFFIHNLGVFYWRFRINFKFSMCNFVFGFNRISVEFCWRRKKNIRKKEQNADSEKKREREKDGKGGKKRRTKNLVDFRLVIDLLGCWLIFK